MNPFVKKTIWRLFNSLVACLVFVPMLAAGADASIQENVGGFIRINAQIEPQNDIQINAKVMARAEKVWVKTGSVVQKGQLLVEFDQAGSRAEIAALQAKLSALNAQQKWLDAELARAQQLQKKGALAVAQVEQLQSQKDALAANRQALRANVQAAKIRLQDFNVRAPIAGVVGSKHIDAGSNANLGQALFWLYEPQKLRLSLNLSPQTLAAVDLKKGLTLVDGGAPVQIPATEIEILPTVDEKSGQVTVRALLPAAALNPSRSVGKMVAVRLPLAANAQKIFTKSCNIVQRNELSAVYLHKNNAPQMRLVRLGKKAHIGSDSMVEILAGLLPAEVGEIMAGRDCD